jgi:hypothetical protein
MIDSNPFEISADAVVHAKQELRDAPPWLAQAVKQLQAITSLPAGWDSHGGSPPDRRCLESAKSLLSETVKVPFDLPKPRINPTPGGGVQFEWESPGKYLEVEVVSADAAEYFFQDNADSIEVEDTLHVGDPLDNLVRLLKRVYAIN